MLKKILLVEDNSKDIELTLAAMASNHLDHEVAVVRDGVAALAYLRREGEFAERPSGHPVVVLLDIKMPKLNGLQVLEAMKSDPALRAIPVVMLTSSREEPDLIKAHALGVNAYVVKPVDFDQFIQAVKQVASFWTVLNETPPVKTHHFPSP